MSNEKLTNVVTPNAPRVKMDGVQLTVANKLYDCPSFKVKDGFAARYRASPLNAGNVLIAPKDTQMTVFNADVLRPGEFAAYFVQDTSIMQVMAFAANCVVNVSCETD